VNRAACNPSRNEEKQAKAAFAHAVKMQQKDLDQSYELFSRAADRAWRLLS